MRHLPAALVLLVVAAVGVAAVRYGGLDDSPGLQLVGVALIVLAAVLAVRKARTPRRR